MGAPSTADEFRTLVARATTSVVHLELRDSYDVDDPLYAAWLEAGGGAVEADPADDWWRELIREVTARGVQVRRARIISEPVSSYIRFEYEATPSTNLAANEQVRWLSRRRASDLCLAGNDFWLFDGAVVLWNHFTGDGKWAGREVSRDPAATKLCATAFEAVWERGIDHADYSPPTA